MGDLTLLGYKVETSLDDTIWNLYVENTFLQDTDYQLYPLDPSTQYFARVSTQYDTGTSNPTSSANDTTDPEPAGGGGGGGGGRSTPDDDVDDDVIISSIELSAPLKTLNIGETSEGVFIVKWAGSSPLTVNEVFTEPEPGIIIITETPITFNPDPTGITTSEIPYLIQAADDECFDIDVIRTGQLDQTPGCVFDSYNIPIAIEAQTVEFGSLSGKAELPIIIVSKYDFLEFIVIGMIVSAVSVILIKLLFGKKKRKKTGIHDKGKRRKVLESRPKIKKKPRPKRR